MSPTNVNTIATGRVKRKFGKRRVGLEAFLGWRTAGKVRKCLIPRCRAVSGATRHALERVCVCKSCAGTRASGLTEMVEPHPTVFRTRRVDHPATVRL